MSKLAKIIGSTSGICGLFILTAILFLSANGLPYGIHLGMNSKEAERKLYQQGFQDAQDKSEFTEETATKYFQKGKLLVGLHWEYDFTPQTPPGLISAITVEHDN